MRSSVARRAASVAVLLTGLAAFGCDPCSGVASCVSAPRLELEGTLVGHIGGLPQRNVRVDVIRTGGVPLANDSVSTLTDAQGHWQIDVPAGAAGNVVVDIEVRPPDYPAYRSVGMHFATTDRLGAGSVLPPWVIDPHFSYALELFFRGPAEALASNTTFEFHRTGGVGFYVNAGGDVFTATTDGSGRASLFDISAHAIGLGDLVGDLVVHMPPPFAVDTEHDVHLAATPAVMATTQVLRLGAGPALEYVAEVHRRRDNAPISGATIAFQHTGGANTSPSSFTATTDATGRFTFPFQALSDGPVIGDLQINSPEPGSPVTMKGFTLKAYRKDEVAFYGVMNVGPCLPWAGYLAIAGHGAQGVQVEVHRSGGVETTPTDYVSTSNSDGYFFVNPQPVAIGVFEADILIHSPAPYAPISAHVSVPTVEDDTTGGVFIGFDLDKQPTARVVATKRAKP